MAASPLFMSAAPRPYSMPSAMTGVNGSLRHSSSGPGGTTSVCPAKQNTGRHGSALRPEIVDRTEAQALHLEADGLEPLDHERLAAAVRRGSPRRARSSRGSASSVRDIRIAGSAGRRRRLAQIPKAPRPTAAISTHAGIARPRKPPVDLGALAGPGQNLDEHVGQRKHLEHEVERGAARRHGARRQALDVQLAHGDADRGERRDADQGGKDAPAAPALGIDAARPAERRFRSRIRRRAGICTADRARGA